MLLAASFAFAMDRRKNQRKLAQKALGQKSRQARFITEYVLRKHTAIYQEASGIYNELKAKYPDKRDLTKTHDFFIRTTNYRDYRDYYNREKQAKQAKVKKMSATTTTTTTTTTTKVDNMDLTIDLLTPQVVAENTGPLQVMPDELYRSLIKELTTDPEIQTILNDTILPQDNESIQNPELEITTDPELIQNYQLESIFEDPDKTPLEKELEKLV